MLTSFKCFRRFFSSRSPSRRSWRGGFTLIELLVVSFIIIIITTFILFNQSKFNSSTLLRSLAYSVALSVRQAQAYGTSSRGFSSGGSIAFAQGYGAYFTSGDLTHYYLFADTTPSPQGNGQRAGDNSEDLPIFTISKGYQISKFCAVLSSGSEHCTSGTSPSITSLTVFFRRPSPDACFATDATGATQTACAPGGSETYTSAYIQLQSSGNTDTRSVKVTSTGQIAVCALNTTSISAC